MPSYNFDNQCTRITFSSKVTQQVGRNWCISINCYHECIAIRPQRKSSLLNDSQAMQHYNGTTLLWEFLIVNAIWPSVQRCQRGDSVQSKYPKSAKESRSIYKTHTKILHAIFFNHTNTSAFWKNQLQSQDKSKKISDVGTMLKPLYYLTITGNVLDNWRIVHDLSLC